MPICPNDCNITRGGGGHGPPLIYNLPNENDLFELFTFLSKILTTMTMMKMQLMVAQMKTWCGVRPENSGYKAVPGVARDRSHYNARFRDRPIASKHLPKAPKVLEWV